MTAKYIPSSSKFDVRMATAKRLREMVYEAIKELNMEVGSSEALGWAN